MEIDIRNNGVSEVTAIRVADKHPSWAIVEIIEKDDTDPAGIVLKDSDDHMTSHLAILNKEHAENVIKGLQKAIELGWVK